MHEYIVLFSGTLVMDGSTGRRFLLNYKIRCESEDAALLPHADWFTHDFGVKSEGGRGCWQWYKPESGLVVTVVQPDLLPLYHCPLPSDL